jgi:hypothetical protein
MGSSTHPPGALDSRLAGMLVVLMFIGIVVKLGVT